ncbi:FG-GAP repeat protein [Streptomyces sp. BK340]|uniref:FG-GAP repeat protein n=1 Tax=Streptomyces sp. BK340 TaxID=2572903 RepID=UPI0011A38ADC|nr:FG-GAP repeat protein [Streptomyces sp. BK340]TVZ84159.1 hypothetical protein FB157_12183 [Streptomyces sp. BK340]
MIILRGSGTGVSGTGAIRVPAPANSFVGEDITAGDFDGDGHPDLFMRNAEDFDLRAVLYGPFGRNGAPAREQQLTAFSTDNTIEDHAEGGKLWLGTRQGLSTVPQRFPSADTAAVGDFDTRPTSRPECSLGPALQLMRAPVPLTRTRGSPARSVTVSSPGRPRSSP